MRNLIKVIGCMTMVLLPACSDTIDTGGGEGFATADYYVSNQRSQAVCLSATTLTATGLLVTEIASGKEAMIFRASEGSGGHAFPSNFFSEFKVFNCTNTAEIFYEGVTDADWKDRGNQQLVLTVTE